MKIILNSYKSDTNQNLRIKKMVEGFGRLHAAEFCLYAPALITEILLSAAAAYQIGPST